MKKSIALAALLLSGCAVTPEYSGIEWEHISHPMAGPPFGPEDEEDALDHVNGYAGWHVGQRGYVEITSGYRLVDEGFYGPDWTGGIRVGVKIHGQR